MISYGTFFLITSFRAFEVSSSFFLFPFYHFSSFSFHFLSYIASRRLKSEEFFFSFFSLFLFYLYVFLLSIIYILLSFYFLLNFHKKSWCSFFSNNFILFENLIK